MINATTPSNGIGRVLADRLGLAIIRTEGHDLVSSCIACSSSDAFRLHQDAGVAHCYSCGGKWSPFQLAESVLGDRNQVKTLLVELGLFTSSGKENGASTCINPIDVIARQKGVSPDSLVAYGAKKLSPTEIQLPAYGPDGKPCSTFKLSTSGEKGLFANRKPAGLFFPHENGAVRIPKSGETWHIVEGPKDAAALHRLDLLACGLNTCRLNPKFGRLFAGVDVILIPDRDRAGDDGAQYSASILQGVAKTVRFAILPAEFKEKKGDDVRDVLRRPDGVQLIKQAIADAQPWDVRSITSPIHEDDTVSATRTIEIPDRETLTLTVHPCQRGLRRLVVITSGDVEFRDQVDINNSTSRERMMKKLASKFNLNPHQIDSLIEPMILACSDECDDTVASIEKVEEEAQSQATLVVRMAVDWELWHTPAGDAFATIPVKEHFENWPVKSRTFRHFVAKAFFDIESRVMNSEALSAALNLLEAKALFEGEERSVSIRIAEHQNNIYLDLCNDEWQVVEITPSGWSVINQSPVHFRRSRGMLPVPIPQSGGSVDEFRQFLNVNESDWILIVAWLIACLRPSGPYPILALFAEQGSGKSTTGHMLRSLVDPNAAPLRAEPKDGRDLMIAANNSWCLCFDNLSHISPWLSDAMCRLSTGGGFATRQLHTDQDEIIFDAQRPMLLTSVEEIATRSDLLDRCQIVNLPTIPKEQRQPVSKLLSDFETTRPRILGAFLDAVSSALRNFPSVQLSSLPRMADFAVWVSAAEEGLGWAQGSFMAAYESNRSSANDLALESCAISAPLLMLLEQFGRWNGTLTELLEDLESRVSDQVKRQKHWPKNARALSGQLKRLSPNLREAGWNIIQERESKRRLWIIEPKTIPVAVHQDSLPLDSDEIVASTDANSDQYDETNYDWAFNDANDGNDANFGDSKRNSNSESGLDNEVPF